MLPLIGSLGTPELLIIFAIIILIFGAAKLPDLARNSGRALRIFKSETKGLINEDKDKTPEQLEIEARQETVQQDVQRDEQRGKQQSAD